MKKIIIIVLGVLLLGVGAFLGRDYLPEITSDQGQLRIQSNPKTTVFLNGEDKGQTPFLSKLKPGDYEVRLLPPDETTTSPWQQSIGIKPGVETFITVNLGLTEMASSWQLVTLEKINRGETELAVFSQTDGSEIFLNGERKGTTPLSFKDIASGKYDLKLASGGYSENAINVEVKPGYKVQLTSQLASLSQTASGSATPGESTGKDAEKKIVVKILSTPTGWLRVREEPNTSGKELAKLNPDEEYPYLEEQGEWYKIEYEEGKEGWISSQYAEKIE